MMFSPLYDWVKNVAGVQAVLGNPVRLYAFGEAPQDAPVPYAVQQTVSGVPENYLGRRPDQDSLLVNVDIYANTMAQARSAVSALAAAIEPVAYITGLNGEFRDIETRLFRSSFTVDMKINR